jgi:phosphonate transport system substrate-binding protein
MRVRTAAVFALVALVAASLGTAVGYAVLPRPTEEKVVVAIQPTGTPEAVREASIELEKFLEQRLGVDVEIYVPTTYAAVVESLRFDHADVGFMSAWPSFLASKLAGGEIALAELREVVIGQENRNETFYFSYWVVMNESPYTQLDQLRGKRVCFPSLLSTSGYVAPLAKLVELGFVLRPESGKEADPKQFFSEVSFAGGYTQCWEALRSGHADVMVIAGDVPEKLYREVLAKTKILEQQGPIPSHSVVFSKDLKEPLRSRLIQALLDLGNPDHRPLMRKFISGIFVGFVETNTERHLASLQKYLEETGLKFSEKYG